MIMVTLTRLGAFATSVWQEDMLASSDAVAHSEIASVMVRRRFARRHLAENAEAPGPSSCKQRGKAVLLLSLTTPVSPPYHTVVPDEHVLSACIQFNVTSRGDDCPEQRALERFEP